MCGVPGPTFAALAILLLLAKAAAGGFQLHHIHGLAVDPGDARVIYIATHAGLVKGSHDKEWQYVGDDRSDFMGFTVHPTVPGLMVASGHPAEGKGVEVGYALQHQRPPGPAPVAAHDHAPRVRGVRALGRMAARYHETRHRRMDGKSHKV